MYRCTFICPLASVVNLRRVAPAAWRQIPRRPAPTKAPRRAYPYEREKRSAARKIWPRLRSAPVFSVPPLPPRPPLLLSFPGSAAAALPSSAPVYPPNKVSYFINAGGKAARKPSLAPGGSAPGRKRASFPCAARSSLGLRVGSGLRPPIKKGLRPIKEFRSPRGRGGTCPLGGKLITTPPLRQG